MPSVKSSANICLDQLKKGESKEMRYILSSLLNSDFSTTPIEDIEKVILSLKETPKTVNAISSPTTAAALARGATAVTDRFVEIDVRASYDVSGSVSFYRREHYEGTVQVPIDIAAEGEDSIREWMEENVDFTDFDCDYGDTDYDNEETNSSNFDSLRFTDSTQLRNAIIEAEQAMEDEREEDR